MKKMLLALAIAFIMLMPGLAQASSFKIGCGYSHTLSDDPIVFPDQAGASHSHDFFGNRATDYESRISTLTGQPTTCGNAGDTAAYWVPSLYLNGSQVKPKSIVAYYYRKTSGTLTPFPQGLEMIAGDSHATTTQSMSVVYWGCGSGSGISKVTAPPDCTGIGHLRVHISFPDCWDGVNLDSANHKSHVAYHSGSSCPAAYPVQFPQLVIRVNYSLEDARSITLASGSYVTEHADYYSVWDEATLAALVASL